MTERECVAFLDWALPELGLRARGFANVRRQVVRRVAHRARELGVDAAGYRALVERDATERATLDALCFVTISRFYRDASVFAALGREHLPRLAAAAIARGAGALSLWSAGCASGEEPYSLALLWHLELARRFPALALHVLATDFDEAVLARAAEGVYERGSLRELPEGWLERGFEPAPGDRLRVRPELRAGVELRRADVRTFSPPEPVDAILCRNVAFTYFGEALARSFAERCARSLVAGGVLVIGRGERLPADVASFAPTATPCVYERRA